MPTLVRTLPSLALPAAALVLLLALAAALWARRETGSRASLTTSRSGPDFVRILHQQYRTADEAQWPPEWSALAASWRELHPGWERRFWTDEEEARLFDERLPEFADLYRDIAACKSTSIVRADLATYAVLYVFGGVYADLDTAPLSPLDDVIGAAVEAAETPLAMLVNIARPELDEDEVRGNGGLEYPFSLDNDVMISTKPGHRFFYEVLGSIAAFLREHNHTICAASTREEPNFDLMYLTAWGRLSLCARAWTASGLDTAGLRFLEGLYLRDREEASFALSAVHLLCNTSLEKLQANPPPRRKRDLRAWLERRLQEQDAAEAPAAPQTLKLPQKAYGELRVWRQAPDLVILPVAGSPASLPKAALRKELRACGSAAGASGAERPQKGVARCLRERARRALVEELPDRDHRHNLLVVFNYDGGVWQGSWDEKQRAQHATAAAALSEADAAARSAAASGAAQPVG